VANHFDVPGRTHEYKKSVDVNHFHFCRIECPTRRSVVLVNIQSKRNPLCCVTAAFTKKHNLGSHSSTTEAVRDNSDNNDDDNKNDKDNDGKGEKHCTEKKLQQKAIKMRQSMGLERWGWRWRWQWQWQW